MASRRGHTKEASSSSSSSSSSVAGERTQDQGPNRSSEYEQRRVRHINAILVRNLTLPDVLRRQAKSHALERPSAPRRSLSTASNASGYTIRRTPSNRTLRPSHRRRASSIVSAHAPQDEEEDVDSGDVTVAPSTFAYHAPSLFQTWDAESLRSALEVRLASAFVSLSRSSDGKEFYRSCVSRQAGLHHAWGRTPDGSCDVEGMHMASSIDEEIGCESSVRLTMWASQGQARMGKAKDSNFSSYVEPGHEAAMGFQLISQQDVQLSKLNKVDESLAAFCLTLPPNAILLGLSCPLAHVKQSEPEESAEGNQKRDARRGGIRRSEVQFYTLVASELSKASIPISSVSPLDKGTVRKFLKEGKMVRSYDIDDILRLLQLQRQQFELLQSVDVIRSRVDAQLDRRDGPIAREVELGEEQERLKQLRVERNSVLEEVSASRRRLQERQDALQRRKARLEIARRTTVKERTQYDELQGKMVRLAKLRGQIEMKIYARRVTLLRQLERIYPIDLMDGAQLLYSIVEIPLANGDGKDERQKEKWTVKVDQNDDIVSSALGMIGQMVALIGAYLDTPLHYPIATAGSRSVIQDGISVMSGPRAFPLYAKGVERYRFEYGHFLLNKDIEQLMCHAGITIMDIRNTLPNLKNLIVTLTASNQASSKLSRRHHVGAHMISLTNSRHEERLSGLGLPSSVSERDGQIGYGSVVSDTNMLDAPVAKRKSRWGMSFGWGSTDGSTLHDKSNSELRHTPPMPAGSQASLPTTRFLGSS